MFASEHPLSVNDDRRPLLAGTTFEGDTSFDNTSTRTPWGQFTLNTTSGTQVSQNGTNLTTASGVFHIQPDSFADCLGSTSTDLATPGICINDGSLDRELRYNSGAVNQVISDRDRFNVFAFVNHDLGNGIELYGELGYYFAETKAQLEYNTSIASGDIVVPANNYYNPFGPEFFSDGSPNPNRLPGLANVPTEGLPVSVDGARFRLSDVGPRRFNVQNDSWRILGGARGSFGDSAWNWDSAILYSEAKTDDTAGNRVSSTLFQQSLLNETPDTYNLFNGADPNNPNTLDSTPNPQSVIDPFLISVKRVSETDLALADFIVSNGEVYNLPGGPLGASFGAEVRHEAYSEDRDPRLDGTITFTDVVTGEVVGSDVMGTSPTSDSSGSRTVTSLFAELSVPVVGDAQQIPLLRHLDFQLAARYEDYSDVGGSGVKPRIAGAWEPAEFVKFRASWSKGFRAPNLLTINELNVARSNTRTDTIGCEAGVRNGTFATFADCSGFTESREEQRAGNPDLAPEDDTNRTFGIVLQPTGFLEGLVITVDRWDIEQEGVVGIFGGGNHLDLDYALRVQGMSNPAVVRAAPTVDQIAFYAGTGLDPAGDILFIQDTYLNLLPRKIAGTDYAIYYALDDTPLGSFDFKINAVEMRDFTIEPSSRDQIVIDAVAGGLIDPSIALANAGSILERNGQPIWQGSATISWSHGSGFGAGFFADYVGDYIDTSAGLDPDDNPFIVDDWTTYNLYGQYEIGDNGGLFSNARFRFGINNLTDKDPPLADSGFGYDGAYHSLRGRYYYADLRMEF
ncbi:MAG: TonB-dependent receptor domain-containing protein [Woeseiaceae bacterium]